MRVCLLVVVAVVAVVVAVVVVVVVCRCGQVQRLTYTSSADRLSEVAIDLYHVRYRPTTRADNADRQSTTVSDTGQQATTDVEPTSRAVSMHTELLSPRAIRYALTNRGALSSIDHRLCWSAVDRVVCGRLTQSGRVVDVRTVLDADAVARTACHGTRSTRSTRRWTTHTHTHSACAH